MMATLVGDPCHVLDVLSDFQMDLLRRLNRKFDSLRRLAQLLEQLGDLSTLIPNIDLLLPIVNIDVSLYRNLQRDCPFLNLPEFDPDAPINELQQKVRDAYNNIMKRLLDHPFIRMGKVQDELDKYQSKLNAAAGLSAEYIRCLQTMCETIRATRSAFQTLKDADIAKEVATYTKNYVDNAGQVLTAPAKAKYEEVLSTVETMQELGADVRYDYASLRSVTAAPEPAPDIAEVVAAEEEAAAAEDD